MVPIINMTRLVVMIWTSGRVSINQAGVRRRMRKNNVVKAGRVVADVAVLCVDKKSVRYRKGSSRMLHLDVNSFKVSTISSKLL